MSIDELRKEIEGLTLTRRVLLEDLLEELEPILAEKYPEWCSQVGDDLVIKASAGSKELGVEYEDSGDVYIVGKDYSEPQIGSHA